MSEEILRKKRVLERSGMCNSGLYAAIKEGHFPRQIKLSARSVGWLASEVDEWIQRRVEASRSRVGAAR
jgi:prophage regulatory protein